MRAMSTRIGTPLIAGEALIIAAPLTALFAIYLALELSQLVRLVEATATTDQALVTWDDIAAPLVAGLSALSLGSGWAPLVTRLRGGRKALRARPRLWWYLCLPGVLVVAVALLDQLLPPHPEDYTPMWSFRTELQSYVVATPLVLPLIHLLIEARASSPAYDPLDRGS